MHARLAVIAVVCSALCSAAGGLLAPAAAQHEHHGATVGRGTVALDTLAVRAEDGVVRVRSGATVVETSASPAAGGSIADLLRTVPGLDVDAEGRISMRGSTSVLVLLNGRRIALTGDALVAFMRQMPATTLQRVEAGTAVSARHGAEGAAGVVNLVSREDAGRRTEMRSLAGSIATQDHYLGSAAAAGRAGDAVDWDAAYSLSAMRPRTEHRTARWSLVPGDLDLRTDEDSRAREEHRLHSIAAGAAASPAAGTSVALRGMYSSMEGAERNSTAFVYTDAAGNRGTSEIASVLQHVIPSGDVNLATGVERGGVHVTSEVRAGFVNEEFRGDYSDVRGGYSYMTRVMNSRQRQYGVRNDIALRMRGIDLDAGHESRIRTVSAGHDADHFGAIVSQSYRYETRVHAGYVVARGSLGGVEGEAGMRVEADGTRMRLDGDDHDVPDGWTRAALRVFPSVRGEWTDDRRGLEYRVAFGRRIAHPDAAMLNPFAMAEDDMNETIGNPSLLPEVSDQLEFGVERHGSRTTVQVTPFMRWTRDPIRPLKSPTARGGTTTTLANLERERTTGADASLRTQVTDHAVVTLAGSVAHAQVSAAQFDRSGMYVTTRLNIDVRLADNTTAHVHAYRRSTRPIEQGVILPAFTSDIALTQRLAGDRARVTLRITDPLRSDRLAFRVSDTAFTQESRRRAPPPLLSLSASWAVGSIPREHAPDRTQGPVRIF